jgi:hypothetical protein
MQSNRTERATTGTAGGIGAGIVITSFGHHFSRLLPRVLLVVKFSGQSR